VAARLAADRLAAAGLHPAAGPVEAVHIRTLGRFAVTVDGSPVPAGAWQSRKARDLLRMLVARRGRPVSRDELSGLLWPSEPPDRVAHRMSVALSTVRAVLDPGRTRPIDAYVCGDAGSLALDLANLAVDAETFASYARYGIAHIHAQRWREAQDALAAAERLYTGDFLEDEPYDDLAVPVREELRATFLQVARALTGLSRRLGHTDDAIRRLARLLGVDPYDEQAHRELVALLTETGRHGEARRAHTRYVRAMREIGVEIV
jgi:DNA-binding SARP family transcriptional activator